MVERQHLNGLFAALADPTRRAIVAGLAAGPRTVGEIAAPFDMSLAAVSKHIHVLDHAGIIRRKRKGRSIRCELQPARLRPVADWIGNYEHFWNERLDKLEQVIKENKRKKS